MSGGTDRRDVIERYAAASAPLGPAAPAALPRRARPGGGGARGSGGGGLEGRRIIAATRTVTYGTRPRPRSARRDARVRDARPGGGCAMATVTFESVWKRYGEGGAGREGRR